MKLQSFLLNRQIHEEIKIATLHYIKAKVVKTITN